LRDFSDIRRYLSHKFSDFTDKTGVERFREVESTGAQVVLTACPACVTQLQYVRGQLDSPLQVMDLITLANRLAQWR